MVVAPVKWTTASNSLPSLSTSLFSLSVLAEADALSQSSSESGNSSQKGNSLSGRAAALAAAEGEERVTVVRECIKEKIGAMLGVNGEDVEASRKIADLGVDSLMAIEVKVILLHLNMKDKDINHISRTGLIKSSKCKYLSSISREERLLTTWQRKSPLLFPLPLLLHHLLPLPLLLRDLTCASSKLPNLQGD